MKKSYSVTSSFYFVRNWATTKYAAFWVPGEEIWRSLSSESSDLWHTCTAYISNSWFYVALDLLLESIKLPTEVLMPITLNNSMHKEVDVSFWCSKLFLKGTYIFQLTIDLKPAKLDSKLATHPDALG